ncbi:MAG: hypothetical protein H6Q65_68 [Firmicutes bacterium]|nr:hypothetical protein [Bacillota bacterium]
MRLMRMVCREENRLPLFSGTDRPVVIVSRADLGAEGREASFCLPVPSGFPKLSGHKNL